MVGSGSRLRRLRALVLVFVTGAAAGAGGALAATGAPSVATHQQAQLAARSLLPSATF